MSLTKYCFSTLLAPYKSSFCRTALFLPSPPTPHYPPPSTTKNPNSRRRRNHNYSLFIIHYSLNKKSAPFQTTDLDIKFQCKIKVCHPPVTQLSPIGNNQNGEFTVAFSRTANLQWLSATSGALPPPAYLVPNSLSPASPTPGVM